MVEELKIHIKNRDFYALSKLIEETQPLEEDGGDLLPESLSRRELLLEELEIQIDDLKSETVRRFDNEEFDCCLETFEFLSRVNPNDRMVKDYLELCKQFATEQTAESNPPTDLSGQDQAGTDIARCESIEECHEAKVGSVDLGTRSLESGPTELTRRMKVCFDNKDFEALRRVVKEALVNDTRTLQPGDKDLGDKDLEEQQLRVAFETHIKDLTAEAMLQFEEEAYSDCLGTFRFLSELQPDDLELKYYIEACREFAQEQPHDVGSWPIDSRPAPSSKPEEQHLEEELTDRQGQVSSSSGAVNAGRAFEVPDPGLVADDGDVHDFHIPDASPQMTAGTTDSALPTDAALPTGNWRAAWLMAALAALGVVCLVIWLATPSSGPKLDHTLVAYNESVGTASEWLQKAESAMVDRRYVTPANDNVVFYCDRVLVSDSLKAKAMELKRESISQAIKQADEFAQEGKYDDATELYQALLNLPQSDGLNQENLEANLKQVKFDSYPVIHNHFLGSCKGVLKINSYVISFVPSGDSKDGFTQQLSRVTIHGLADTLRIEVNQKNYRFEVIRGKNNRDRKTQTRELHESLISRLHEAKS